MRFQFQLLHEGAIDNLISYDPRNEIIKFVEDHSMDIMRMNVDGNVVTIDLNDSHIAEDNKIYENVLKSFNPDDAFDSNFTDFPPFVAYEQSSYEKGDYAIVYKTDKDYYD